MHRKYQNIALLTILFNMVSALHFDYEISRGRKMWMGVQRAVHYFDHFKLLTHRMTDIKGLVTSYFPLLYKNEWSLNFELLRMGPSLNDKDGFMLLLSSQNIDTFELPETIDKDSSFLDSVVSLKA